MFVFRNNQDLKYKTNYKGGMYNIIYTSINGIITPKMGTMADRINIHRIKP